MGDGCTIVDTISTVCASTPPLPATGGGSTIGIVAVGLCIIGGLLIGWFGMGSR